MSGTIFYICFTSAISALSLLRAEFQLDQLYQNDGEKDARQAEGATHRFQYALSTRAGTECVAHIV